MVKKWSCPRCGHEDFSPITKWFYGGKEIPKPDKGNLFRLLLHKKKFLKCNKCGYEWRIPRK